MQTKFKNKYRLCTKCETSKLLTPKFFHYRCKEKKIFSSKCKVCTKKYDEEYRKNNSGKKRQYDEEYRKNNKDKLKEYQKEYCERNKNKKKEYYEENKEKMREHKKQYYEENREKIKEIRRIYYEEHKEKVKERSKEWYKNNKEKRKENKKEHYEKNKEETKEKMKEYYEKNRAKMKEKVKRYYKKNKGKVSERNKEYLKSFASFYTYKDRLTVDEDPIEDDNGNLLVLCTYCGKRFIPINRTVRDRIAALSTTGGENRLYCSEGCKLACPVFHKKVWSKGFKLASSREVDPLFRKMVLKLDNWTCQRCGKTTEEAPLHAHHIQGATQQPMLSNDVSNGITYCKPCHKWVHSKKGCRYIDLRRKVC